MAMPRRIVPVALAGLAALVCAVGSAAPARAGSLACTPAITKLRYRPQITYACTGTSALTSVSTSVVRLPAGTPVGSAPTWSGLSATVDVASLAAGARYRIDAAFADGDGDTASVSSTWTTLPPPAHPGVSVEYLTAMDPLAVRDMLHRVDRTNLVAVPTAG